MRRSVEKRCEEGLQDCVQEPQMRRVRLGGLKEGSEGGSSRKPGCDHCCEVGPRRMGRGDCGGGVAGVGH